MFFVCVFVDFLVSVLLISHIYWFSGHMHSLFFFINYMVQQAWKRQKRKQKEKKIMNKKVFVWLSEKMNYPLVQNYLKTENSKSEPHSDYINIQESNRLNFEWSSMVAGIADNFFRKSLCVFLLQNQAFTPNPIIHIRKQSWNQIGFTQHRAQGLGCNVF